LAVYMCTRRVVVDSSYIIGMSACSIDSGLGACETGTVDINTSSAIHITVCVAKGPSSITRHAASSKYEARSTGHTSNNASQRFTTQIYTKLETHNETLRDSQTRKGSGRSCWRGFHDARGFRAVNATVSQVLALGRSGLQSCCRSVSDRWLQALADASSRGLTLHVVKRQCDYAPAARAGS
jgi:hypothetical protein